MEAASPGGVAGCRWEEVREGGEGGGDGEGREKRQKREKKIERQLQRSS